MFEAINSIDTTIFLFLNGIHSPFFDSVMDAISNKWTWIPFYISLIYIIIRNWRKEALYVIPILIVCIVLADQISSSLIKVWVARPRPTHNDEIKGIVHIVNNYRGGQFGFVSSHAANAMALASFCTLLFRQKVYTWILIIWALITGYSRIYLGVHYPLDVLGGFLVGLLVALFSIWLLKKICAQAFQKKLFINSEKTFISKVSNYLPLWALLLTAFSIIVFSWLI